MKKIIPALLLPILALAVWSAMLEFRIISGREIRLKITGYDPRDLLSGHYMQYRLDLGDLNACPDADGLSCVCLYPSSDGIHHEPSYQRTCYNIESDSACSLYLRGTCESGRFTTGLERFSIPELWAPELAVLPQNSSAVVSLDSEGIGQVTALFVDNEPLETYVLKKRGEKVMLPVAPPTGN